MKKSNEFDFNEAIELFNEGKGWREIAKQLNVHPYSIQWALENKGFRGKNKVGRKRSWDIELAKKLREKGMTIKAIAEKLGVAESTVGLGLRYKGRIRHASYD